MKFYEGRVKEWFYKLGDKYNVVLNKYFLTNVFCSI